MEKYFARLFMYPPQNKTYEKEIGLHSYKYTSFYDTEAEASAKGMELLQEAYKDIKAGKIKFNWHYGFIVISLYIHSVVISIFQLTDFL